MTLDFIIRVTGNPQRSLENDNIEFTFFVLLCSWTQSFSVKPWLSWNSFYRLGWLCTQRSSISWVLRLKACIITTQPNWHFKVPTLSSQQRRGCWNQIKRHVSGGQTTEGSWTSDSLGHGGKKMWFFFLTKNQMEVGECVEKTYKNDPGSLAWMTVQIFWDRTDKFCGNHQRILIQG